MNRERVTIIRGGPSEEYEVSMRTGANVLRSLARQNISARDIIITKQEEWLDQGMTKSPEQVFGSTDVVFLALHGTYGEDGEIQKILQRYNIPFTGSRSLPSAIAFNKPLTKETLRAYDILMPEHTIVQQSELDILTSVAQTIKSSFGPEYILKPLANGSSVGVRLIREGQSLEDGLREALANNEQVMVEEFIRGREATCATLENFRNELVYVFPAIEIIPPPECDFFTTEAKYNGKTKEICPADFSYKDRDTLTTVAAQVHTALGLSQYSRSDFILKDGKVYFLEVNTLPGLTEESLYPKAAGAVGLSFDQLVQFLVETAEV